ncbi:MAG: hypothetical protein AAGU75_06930 [Bacillota bacterium]
MEEQMDFLGLPVETWLIVGGLYFVATFLPSIVAFVLGRKEAKKPNE